MRISTTTIESFRLWSDPEQDWMPEQELIDTICGKFVPNEKVLLGQAFGRVLETPERYIVPGGYRIQPRGAVTPYFFDDATMAEPFKLIDRRGVFEAKAQKAYGDVDVVAMADHLLGAHLSEYKTTTSTFNFEKYAESCQWRFMVDIFEPLLVTYHVFCLDDHGNGVVELKSIESFNLFPYDNLHADCEALLKDFCAYVRARGLEGVLQQRQRDAA